MDKNRNIQPVGAVANILRAKPLGNVKLFKRPEYLPNSKRRKLRKEREEHEDSGEQQLVNRAGGAGELGGRVDFKV